MKLKSLLFGSAAVIAAGTGAQAADLPMVEPVEYVRICDAFGTGYYYIPGTDTCLRVAGRVRVEERYQFGRANDLASFYQVGNPNAVNNWQTRARGYVRLDARTQSDIGLVRTYISMHMNVGPAGVTGNGGGENYGGTAPTLEYAFIQISNDWGTYTAGHADSFFDFYDEHGFFAPIGIDDSTTAATLFAWTFAGGNGFSFTISAEDPASAFRRRNGDDDYEGQEAPDGVANIRIDQGWGSAQVMGAVRHINDDNGDGIGFAVGAGLSLGIPGGWKFDAQGGFSRGAIAYVTGDPGGLGDFDGPNGRSNNQNEAWAVKAGIKGPISPKIDVWLDGSYTHVQEANNQDEYDNWGLSVGGLWKPVSGLVMGPQFSYENLNLTDRPVDGVGERGGFNNYDVYEFIWRVQRDF